MKHQTPSVRYLLPNGLVVGLAIASRLLWPVQSSAADMATAFPAVAELPIQTNMPNALVAADGKTITTPEQWQQHREAVKPPFPVIVQPSFSAIVNDPPPPVTNTLASGTNAAPVKKAPNTPDVAVRSYTQALERGYAVVTFFYQDCGKDGGDYRTTGFFPAYPDYDWADLSAWAWGMSRCVDYLETQSFADKSKFIALGHSRLGKATLVAGAFDERFALCAPAGSGCAGTGAYRFNGKARNGREGLNEIVKNFPQWTIPSLVEFSNRVERLPFDQHWLIDLVAPRSFIAADGLDDTATSVNALVQSYLAAKPVYALLGVPDHLGIHFRPGPHRLAPEDWTAILDFADQQLRGMDVNLRFDQLPPQELWH